MYINLTLSYVHLIANYYQLFTCSSPDVDRCSDPLPWDARSSPETLAVACLAISHVRAIPSIQQPVFQGSTNDQ